MLPNWLLGKSKSKLQEILGGGGGGGTTYTAGDGIDISNGVISFDPETTPVIDSSKIDGLDDDLATLAPKTALSNPNILHNPWFTVNQRGVTSVTVSNEYIADRWRVWSNTEFAATRNSDGFIVIDNSSGDQNAVLYQKRTTTYLTSLLGNKLTASVLLSDGTVYSGTITYDGSSKNYVENEYIRLYSPSSITNQILGLAVKPGASVTIKALKLEVGVISTLHLDPRPEYATELAKCQRYFQRIAQTTPGATLWMATYRNSNTLRTVLPLAAPMRAEPSVTVNGTVGDYINGGLTMSKAGPSLTNGGVFCIIFNISKSDVTWSDGVSKLICPESANFYIDFSAEL